MPKYNFDRIAVIGCPGSGKTTFARQLGDVLNREVTHLDKLLWNPNWQMLEYDKRVEIHNQIVDGDTWLIDGMWKSHLADRFPRATLVFFLDYRRSLCVRRAIRRRVRYAGKQRSDIADGCKEKLDRYFLHYIWTFKKNVRPLILQLAADNPQVQVVTFTNPQQTKLFLQQLKQTPTP